MNIRKFVRRVSQAAVILVLSTSAQAAVLSIEPVEQFVDLGTGFTLDINISGLGAGSSPSLSTFDLDLVYDSTIMTAVSVTFGNQLDLFGFGSVQDVMGGGGVLNLSELSLDGPAILDSLQLDAFTLATVGFVAIHTGFSDISLDNVILGDSLGDPFAAELGSARVNVPEPSTLALLGLGLAGLGFARRRKA